MSRKRKNREPKPLGEVVVCPYCGYRWNRRTPHPKECPACKKYLHRRGVFT